MRAGMRITAARCRTGQAAAIAQACGAGKAQGQACGLPLLLSMRPSFAASHLHYAAGGAGHRQCGPMSASVRQPVSAMVTSSSSCSVRSKWATPSAPATASA